MIELKDQRCSFRCSTDFLEEMSKRSIGTPLSLSSFIVESAKIGAPILEKRFKDGEKLSDEI